jgi:ferredoxin
MILQRDFDKCKLCGFCTSILEMDTRAKEIDKTVIDNLVRECPGGALEVIS